MTIRLSTLAPLEGQKLWGFVEQARKIRLATAVDGGPLIVSPAWFVVRDQTVFVALDPTVGDPGRTTTVDADHIANVEAGGKVSAVIDAGDEMDNVHAARFAGSAEIVTDKAVIEELLDLVAEKYFYVGHPHLEYYFSRGAVSNRRWCKLLPDELEGWDLRELPQPPVADMLAFPKHLAPSSAKPNAARASSVTSDDRT
jgi:hypothetical protein